MKILYCLLGGHVCGSQEWNLGNGTARGMISHSSLLLMPLLPPNPTRFYLLGDPHKIWNTYNVFVCTVDFSYFFYFLFYWAFHHYSE